MLWVDGQLVRCRRDDDLYLKGCNWSSAGGVGAGSRVEDDVELTNRRKLHDTRPAGR